MLGSLGAAASQSSTGLPQSLGSHAPILPSPLHPNPSTLAAAEPSSSAIGNGHGQQHGVTAMMTRVCSLPIIYSTCPDDASLGPDGETGLGQVGLNPQELIQLELLSPDSAVNECSDSFAITAESGSGAPPESNMNTIDRVTRAAIQQIHQSLSFRHEAPAPAVNVATSSPPPRRSLLGVGVGEGVTGHVAGHVGVSDRLSCSLPLLGGEDFEAEQHVVAENDYSEDLLTDSNFRCDDMGTPFNAPFYMI